MKPRAERSPELHRLPLTILLRKRKRKPKPLIPFGKIIALKLQYLEKASAMKEETFKIFKESDPQLSFCDAEAIMNFFARTVYDYCMERLREDCNWLDFGLDEPPLTVSDDDINGDDFNDGLDIHFANLENDWNKMCHPLYLDSSLSELEHFLTLDGDLMHPETKATLYKIGGGCIGQIKNVTKRRKENPNLTLQQRIRERKIYNVVKIICQSREEKEQNIPVSLKIRDHGKKGGMMFPKPEFLPFIETTVNIVRKVASLEGLRNFKSNMIKVCKEKLQSYLNSLWILFCKGLPEPYSPCDDGIQDVFAIWLRKISNARIQEFFSVYMESVSRESLKLQKGGQTLRDRLFAAVSQNKKLKKQLKGPESENKTSKKPKPKKASTTVKKRKLIPAETNEAEISMVEDNQTDPEIKNTKSTSSPVATTSNTSQRYSRRMKKKKLFEDFIADEDSSD